jgi:hypothetical protein
MDLSIGSECLYARNRLSKYNLILQFSDAMETGNNTHGIVQEYWDRISSF